MIEIGTKPFQGLKQPVANPEKLLINIEIGTKPFQGLKQIND
jgi:hypothetical protein